MRRLCRLSPLLVLVVLLYGCTLLDLRKDNTFSQDSCLITGEVFTTEPVKKPIIVVAYTKEGNQITIAHHTVLHEPGRYALLVPQGRYWLFAFEDANGNLILDREEPAGVHVAPDAIHAAPGGLVKNVVMVLSRDNYRPQDFHADTLTRQVTGSFKWHSTQVGAIMDINDPVFSAEYGQKGFWAPFDFFRELGANIYFLEPYDGKKIPILLVHGASGSPQDWRYFIDHVDRSRYQVWIYYYPSGARLKTMSDLMVTKIHDLYRKYRFEKLYITAHSMGGLVVRYGLTNSDFLRHYVRLFISISTPFGGETLAKTGVNESPAVIPSWKDMSPDSEYIRSAFARRIPPVIKDYLFFGHKGNRNPLRPNNDSTVTLESMLDPRAQSDAIKVFGFNEDHISILNSPGVFAHYQAILDDVEKEEGPLADKSRRGKVRFRYAIDEAGVVPPLWMTLILTPQDKKRAEFIIEPDPLKTDQEIVPLIDGAYDVGLIAWGFKVSPEMVTVTIVPDRMAEVAFGLKSHSMVTGQIIQEVKTDELFWGFLPSMGGKKKVTAITLSGNGLTRRIVPEEMAPDTSLQAFLAYKDFFFRDWFYFFTLPDGEYQITVEAQGCAPVVQKVTIIPKTPNFPMRFVLCR